MFLSEQYIDLNTTSGGLSVMHRYVMTTFVHLNFSTGGIYGVQLI